MFGGLLITGKLLDSNDAIDFSKSDVSTLPLVCMNGMDIFISLFLHYAHLRAHRCMCHEAFGISPFSFVTNKTFVMNAHRIDSFTKKYILLDLEHLFSGPCNSTSNMTHVLELNIKALSLEYDQLTIQDTFDKPFDLYVNYVTFDAETRVLLLWNFISQFYSLQINTKSLDTVFIKTIFDNFMGTEQESSLDLKIINPSSRLKFRNNVYIWRLYISLLHSINSPQKLIREMFESAIKAMTNSVDQRIIWKEFLHLN